MAIDTERRQQGLREFADWLSSRNLRVTSERLAVLEEIMKAPGHIDIEFLLDRFRRRRKAISRATIYRTLAHLLESGMVQKIVTGHGQPRYEKMYGRKHHDHMICLGCGSLIEFTNDEIERLQDWVAGRRKFRIVSHTLQLRGYCEQCDIKKMKK